MEFTSDQQEKFFCILNYNYTNNRTTVCLHYARTLFNSLQKKRQKKFQQF